MKRNLIEKILGIILILSAFYTLDFSTFNGTSVFMVFNLSGLSYLLNDTDSEFCEKLSQVCRKTALVISIITIVKIIFLG
ncbi:MAG: hypothetical protein ACR2HG_02475 [Pyrinomonadaceae bacterium]